MSIFEILASITPMQALDFSANFDVATLATPITGQLMPDQKTLDIAVEYTRLVDGANIPVAGNVHAYDTEAYIGSRDDIERFRLEPFFIKEKINQGENLRRVLNALTTRDAAIDYIFNDWGRMLERVTTRAAVMKSEFFADARTTVDENNVDLVIDYGLPAERRVTWDWSAADQSTFNPWLDLRNARRAITAAGGTANTIMLSQELYDILMEHPATQIAIYGNIGEGRLVTAADLERVAREYAGISRIIVNEEMYRRQIGTVLQGQPKYEKLRHFPVDRVSMFYTNPNGGAGVGLWGVTPEEEAYASVFDTYSPNAAGTFATVTQWSTPDPVAVWTKSSGVFIPMYPDVENSMLIATVTMPANP